MVILGVSIKKDMDAYFALGSRMLGYQGMGRMDRIDA